MQVKVIKQSLVPGMKNGCKTQLAAQFMFWVSRELAECSGHRIKENIKNHFLVTKRYWIQFVWDGEHTMEIPYRQKFCFTIFKPVGFGHCLAFGAMAIAAGVIADSFKTAMAAGVYMAMAIGAVGIDQQTNHHRRVKSRVTYAIAAIFFVELRQINLLDSIKNKPRQMIFRNPDTCKISLEMADTSRSLIKIINK